MLVWFLDLLGLLYHSTVNRKDIADEILSTAHPFDYLLGTKTLLCIAIWLNSVFYSLFTYLNKFTYLNTFKSKLAPRCLDN